MSVKKITEKIQYKSNKIQESIGEYYLHNSLVWVKDPLPKEINIKNVISKIEKTIPQLLIDNLDSIFIGQFKEFIERDINALYLNGAIYVTNEQDSEEDLVDDIVHEIAHLVEEQRGFDIYGDGLIEKEFLAKRKSLYKIISQSGIKVDRKAFLNVIYDIKFDNFLHNVIGYDRLSIMTANLFASPYAATSLREYFADGFEDFMLHNDVHILRKTSPQLYLKLDSLI